MNIYELFTPAAVGAYFSEVYSNTVPGLGEALFPRKKKAGLDLKWLKGSKGLPVSLMPSAFDAKATFRDRIGVQKIETEMPFFREGYKIKEHDRQELLRASESGDPYAQAVLSRVFDDVNDLIAGADVVAERMRMALLFPENGNVVIGITANGMNYTYNYDADGSWKSTNYVELTSTAKWDAPTTADPVASIQSVQRSIRSSKGAELTVAIMNTATFAKMTACAAMVNRISAFSKSGSIAYITDAEATAVLQNTLGVTVFVYDKMYKDESGVSHSYVPDGYVALLPQGAVGATWFGTTPEEADLMGKTDAEVMIVNTGVAISREIQQHPVNVNIFASEICLPSYEAMDSVACMKVY